VRQTLSKRKVYDSDELLIDLRNSDVGLSGEMRSSVKKSFRMPREDFENLKCLVGQAVSFLRSALFWGVTQRRVVIPYSRFRTTYRSSEAGVLHWTSWPLKMGPIRCPETSVKGYHSTLRNTPEERRSHQHRGGSLKPRFISVTQKALQGIGKPSGVELLLRSRFLHFFVNASLAELLRINIGKFLVYFIRSSVQRICYFL
jgi:hypothetical protein